MAEQVCHKRPEHHVAGLSSGWVLEASSAENGRSMGVDRFNTTLTLAELQLLRIAYMEVDCSLRTLGEPFADFR